MSDDIDIEEHDLLEDPAIKSIFPDISKLKQEILDYYDEEPDQEAVSNEDTAGTSNSNQDHVNASLSDTVPSNTSLDNTQDCPLPENTLTLYKNKIILGSKPSQVTDSDPPEKDVKPFSAKVQVEDFSYHLRNSSRYCKICCILFSNRNDLEVHKTVAHSVANATVKKKLDKHKCCICNTLFANAGSLRRHQKNIHNSKKFQQKVVKRGNKKPNVLPKKKMPEPASVHNSEESQSKVVKRTNKKDIPANDNKQSEPTPANDRECFHCRKVFSSQKALIDHIYTILQPSTSNSPAVNKHKVNKQKSNGVLSQKTQNLETSEVKNAATISDRKNKNSKRKLPSNTQANTNSTSLDGEFYRCHYCSYYFNSVKFYAAHVTNKHKVSRIPKVKKTVFNPKCKYCLVTNTSIKSYNAHLHKRHVAKINENIEISKENRKNNLKPKAITVSTKKTDNSKVKTGISKVKNDISKVKNDISKVKNDISKIKTDNSNIKMDNNEVSSLSELYRCCYCSYYFISVKFCALHMLNKHKVQKIPKLKSILFDPKCKYCSGTFANYKGYNSHLHRMHSKRINEGFKVHFKDTVTTTDNKQSKSKEVKNKAKFKKSPANDTQNTDKQRKVLKAMNVKYTGAVKIDIAMLKSVLFKCNKCDIHFLSIKTALDHSNHMELLINWKCNKCYKIFKRKDKAFHEKQHTFSNVFTVYDITEEDIPKVLYKCSKCTMHSDVINCLTHYTNCRKKTQVSSYCNICDILIANDSKNLHEYYHNNKSWQPNDFIIIESEFMVLNDSSGSKNTSGRCIVTGKLTLKQYYCDTCKCCISNVILTRQVHIQSRCSHMSKHTCLNCGLVTTTKSRESHQKMHLLKNDLKLQDYTFYDLKSGKQIHPPIPDYHKCGICDTHFISKRCMRSHLCKNNDYLMCTICNKKFWKPYYNLHMAFHSYSMKKDADQPKKTSSRISKAVVMKPDINLTPPPVVKKPSKSIKRKDAILLLYTCNNCNITVDSYDKVIEHCQKHFLTDNIKSVLSTCKSCRLNFDLAAYSNHLLLHEKYEKSCFENIQYDSFYFKFHNNMWLRHLFGSRPIDRVKEIIKSSIYQFEHRFKMEIIQEGAPEFTMYKCAICQCFIEAELIYKHIKTVCTKIRKYECLFCGLPFISALSRTNHENLHSSPEISSKSFNFRIVIFNRPEDKESNSKTIGSHNYYVFYQCRKCCGTVNKSEKSSHDCNKMKCKECSYCGLLINENDYDSHISKHKTLHSYVFENMKVVLFGENDIKTIESSRKNSFRGAIFDFTFYRCTNCKISLKSIPLDHSCPPVNSRIKCSTCSLYLYQHAYVAHIKCHENDPDFELENMNIIEFDPSITNSADNTEVLDESVTEINSNESAEKIEEPNVTDNETQISISEENVDSEKFAQIYKCSCGLHFLDKSSITEHFNDCGNKVSKQNCSKCGLMFTTKVLFTHLLLHHGDKNNTYKLDVVDVPKSSGDE